MSRTFYPSDEYDSFELERERPRRRRHWSKTSWRNDDDDDDLPPTPVAARLPKTPTLGAAEAA
jgi:hypothetical protein